MNSKTTIIRRSKKREEEEEDHGGSWKIALADFMFALMITFLAIAAINSQNEEQTKLLADYFRGVDITKNIEKLSTTFEEVKETLDEQGIIVSMEKNANGIVIKFDSTSLFKSGSANLKNNAKKALEILAKETIHTGLFFHVYGYTDDVPVRKGSDIQNNLILSIMRATEAAKAIIEGGIASDRITIHGEGLLNPISTEDSKSSRAKNRRVELYMSYSSVPRKIYGKNVKYQKPKNNKSQ